MTKEIELPKWLVKRLLQWVERAYRRGYQHGLVAGENGWKHDDKLVMDYRFPNEDVDFATFAATNKNGKFIKKCGLPLDVKHLLGGGGDAIPFIQVDKVGSNYIFRKEN